MKTKTINLYTYEELSKEAQEKALSDHARDGEYHFLEDDLIEFATEQLKAKGYTVQDLKVLYSFSYGQGDGLTFQGNLTIEGKNVGIKQQGNYHHENSNTFTFEDSETGEELEDDESLIEELRDLMKKTAKHGYEHIEHEQSEECFKDQCEANEYTFKADGEMENL